MRLMLTWAEAALEALFLQANLLEEKNTREVWECQECPSGES